MGRAMIGAWSKILAVFLAAFAVVASARAEPVAKADFGQQVLTIDQIYTDLSRYSILEDQLFHVIPQFTALAARGDDYVDDCINFLSEPSRSQQQRRIAIRTMHKLSLHSYIRFSNAILDLYDKHLVSLDEVTTAIIPVYNFSHIYADNFFDPDVRNILTRTRSKLNAYPDVQQFITYVLFGFAAFDTWRHGPGPYK
jgi:hypothetical protein